MSKICRLYALAAFPLVLFGLIGLSFLLLPALACFIGMMSGKLIAALPQPAPALAPVWAHNPYWPE